MYFHYLPTSSIKFTSEVGKLFPGAFSAMQTEIDVTLNPLSPIGPLDKWPAVHRGMAVSTRAQPQNGHSPFVVGTGVLLEATQHEGGSDGSP